MNHLYQHPLAKAERTVQRRMQKRMSGWSCEILTSACGLAVIHIHSTGTFVTFIRPTKASRDSS